MIITAFVLLKAAHRYAARAYRNVVAGCVLHDADDGPLSFARVRVAFLELAEHDDLLGVQRSEAAYEEIGLEGGDFRQTNTIKA